MNQAEYSTKPTKKAQYIIKRAITKHKIDINKPINDWLIYVTEYIARTLNYNQRETCRLATTMQVIKAIEYMKENNLL